LPCTENDQSHFLNLYTNKHEDTELRIAAYLAIMQCPSPHAIRIIKDTLYSEDVNQGKNILYRTRLFWLLEVFKALNYVPNFIQFIRFLYKYCVNKQEL